MFELVELTSKAHKNFKVVPQSKTLFAQGQQIMSLKVSEVSQAATNLPVIYTRSGHDGGFVLSALTGLTPEQNLFVQDDTWTATFTPSSMQTHPMYLMKSPKEENAYTIGIDENSTAFSTENGEALFDEKGAATLYLSKVKALLEADIKHSIETHQFTQKLDTLGLLKAIDLNIQFDSGIQRLNGIYVIDEAKFQQLGGEILAELNQLGYLIPINAMLISLYQLNALIRRYNAISQGNQIKQLKMEVAKDANAF
ncbi:SapC family protein [Aliiglaciecola sp. M165]|uniref:SapC family protein n=1 Tax=Aliiglaciecola sp. M165 TaxID=2593649 RepID=UPI00117EAFCA|nr:SapC family protein [Aliiglaciecola sp. M165]TRY31944.1 SapC family protein [Aliiglaciecola sp. M165]